ncbi:MAG: TrkA-like protein, partial [uncultured Nocardioidaceae bacterium]
EGRHRRSRSGRPVHRPRADRQRPPGAADRQGAGQHQAGAGAAGRVAAGRLVRDVVAGGGQARALRRGDRGYRGRQGQPGHLAARQDRVQRPAHGGAGEPPEQRMAVHRGVGGRRQRVHPAHHVRARRRGGERRRPGPVVHLPQGQREPGRDDAALRLPVRRQAVGADPLAGEHSAGDDPARRDGLRPDRGAAGRGGRRTALRLGGGVRGRAGAAARTGGARLL